MHLNSELFCTLESCHSAVSSHVFLLPQQIDEMLAGALTQEDEDAVLAELEAITQVGVELHL